ncbi:hypothetical protein, partial [Hydrogenophaga sp.]|uniref:hypothetical protein n=1 Tax=Hydrogenophaga sp. TaxID=1904254 RepID=UPI003AF7BFA6
ALRTVTYCTENEETPFVGDLLLESVGCLFHAVLQLADVCPSTTGIEMTAGDSTFVIVPKTERHLPLGQTASRPASASQPSAPAACSPR